MANPILAAEYTNGSKTRSAVLTINLIANGERRHVSEHVVAGKREARKVAAECGAKPWNF